MNKIRYRPSALTESLSKIKNSIKKRLADRFTIPDKAKDKKQKLKNYFEKTSELAFQDELEKIALIVIHKNKKGKWIKKCAELFKEAKKKTHFKVLQENKVPLSEEERGKVMNRKAVWHHGPNGEETPAVWKSVNEKTGKTTFITNTHRAYNTAPSVEGAIGRYHKFIKGTA